jgi:hypothetical protein
VIGQLHSRLDSMLTDLEEQCLAEAPAPIFP